MSPTKWSINRAAVEFDIHRQTLTKRLAALGIEPDKAKKYTTAEIIQAIYGDLEAEKTRLTREQADIGKIKKQELLKALVPVPLIESVWSQVTSAYKDRVLSAPIPPELKDELLAILEPAKIDEYFAAASKLAAGLPEPGTADS